MTLKAWRSSFVLLAGLAAAGACKKTAPEVKPAASSAETAHAATAPQAAVAPSETNAEAVEATFDTKPPSGVDESTFDAFERKVFYRIVNNESSLCGKAESLIASAKTDGSCPQSRYAARYVARLVRLGFTDSEIEEALIERYRKAERAEIDLAGSPVKGGAHAPVTLVEFVDYECPHCARVQPVLATLLDEYGHDLRVVMKHYPLGQHTNARLAARAAVAAHNQGKFWTYNEKIWANADFLTAAKLESLAQETGLDLDRFIRDINAPETDKVVRANKDQGSDLGITSTPALFINGKRFTDPRDVESFRDWIDEELRR